MAARKSQFSPRKYFWFSDNLEEFMQRRLKRNSQLFIISLVAFENARKRRIGSYLNKELDNANEYIQYIHTCFDREVRNRIGFSVATMVRIRKDMARKWSKTEILFLDQNNYQKGASDYRGFSKVYNSKYQYRFLLKKNNLLRIPERIIYDSSLQYSEKMAIIWSISLKEKFNRIPYHIEIEKVSGISTRTIQKAKSKYLDFFH